MEILKDKIKNERKGPESKQKMRYFKISLSKFRLKSQQLFGSNDACQWCLRLKIGV